MYLFLHFVAARMTFRGANQRGGRGCWLRGAASLHFLSIIAVTPIFIIPMMTKVYMKLNVMAIYFIYLKAQTATKEQQT